jgi:ATP-dependent helicase/nuclease subunit A
MTRPRQQNDGPTRAGQVILASAGTGKTYALTSRLIDLLHAGEDPGALLTTTFTRMAAGEILARVLERLADAAATASPAQVEPKTLTASTLLDRVARNLDRVSIGTIDALFARLAGAYGIEVGLPPAWRLADEAELARLHEQALDRTLAAMTPGELKLLTAELQSGKAKRSVRATAGDLIARGLPALLATRHHPEAWGRVGEGAEAPLAADRIAAAVDAVRGAAASLPITKAKQQVDPRYAVAYHRALNALQRGAWEEFISAGLSGTMARGGTTYYRVPIPVPLFDALEPLVRHAKGEVRRVAGARNRALRELVAKFDRELATLKRRAGVLGFDDIPRALRDGQQNGAVQHLYYRLDARVRHVLIDEFQDTSLEQFAVLEPIIDEVLAEPASGRSVLCVGDVKQSLYGWRGAEPALLPALARRWPALEQKSLAHNFRSAPVILETVNAVFGTLPDNLLLAGSPAARVFAERFETHTAQHTDRPGAARLLVAPAADAGERGKVSTAEQRARNMRFAAERAAAIARAKPGARVAILLRTNRWMGDLIYSLRGLGIEAAKEGGNPLTDTPAVAAVVSALHLTRHPGDTAAVYHVATSPLGRVLGITKPLDAHAAAEPLARLRAELEADGLRVVLERWARALAPDMSPRTAERFEQVLDRATLFEAAAARTGRADPADFARDLAETGVEEPGAARVRVTTIHKAKGLEYDAVVLPELDGEWRLRNHEVLVARDPADPLGPPSLVTLLPNELMRTIDPQAAAAHAAATQRLHEGELSGLYVALTRAKHLLEIIVPPERALDAGENLPAVSAARLLRAALAPEPEAEPGAELWTAPRSAAEWLVPVAPAAVTNAEASAADTQASNAATDRAPTLDLKPAQSPPVWLRRRVSPSGLEGGGSLRLGEILRLPEAPTSGRAAGSLLHAWFELIDWADRPAPSDEALARVADRLGVAPAVARELRPVFDAALKAPAIRRRLSASFYTQRHAGSRDTDHTPRREWTFAVPSVDDAGERAGAQAGERPGGAILWGSMDRVVLTTQHGRVVAADLLDFKTDAVDPERDARGFAERVEHYRPQIAAYRAALVRRLGLPASGVTAALLFTRSGRVVDLE